MYKYVLNLVVKISLMFAQYFEYYAIILRGAVFLWTQYSHTNSRLTSRVKFRGLPHTQKCQILVTLYPHDLTKLPNPL